ncbi:platelet binding protein GspB [Anastrepha ludens]|uniref:platelet binding protein GspB n=1 Tax=Anastrepha ludens TaxID=28586 RepID=UPI0023AF98A3|nr:platelet binding protein GspB [Anastrepha ludens]XP_053945764.1 platelet binding protein GspB [Anastrepha ludens]XP_053945765.1 platelet binding protein GspB [Anastrepha ludens]XP_053945766.1 platelet binding protein GspB [Anastrepha ludens]XP_053945767.1 platelet binding protein GspB [Anastrepha ludens]XP_053945768.1 platelet binding protein GspB [Anastrepha ludens]XP_053945769.1 platelet binding protein GspB [Anastrepha ludens]
MSSSICPHFTQNAWKKDLCSNCFKSKDEHKPGNSTYTSKYSSAMDRSKFTSNLLSKTDLDSKKTDYPNKNKSPVRSIMKKSFASLKSKSSKGKTHKVSFPKNISEVIGVGGEWSDNDSDDDDDHDFMNIGNERDDNAATSTDDEETLELNRITRANTDFNMNNGNLLGDPQENIKRSFAALKLGAPQVDKEGKKQTLKINVMPFGVTASTDNPKTASSITSTTAKAKFETRTNEPSEQMGVKQCATVVKSIKKATTATTSATIASTTATKITTTAATTTTKTVTSHIVSSASSLLSAQAKQEALAASDGDGKNSPPIERAMEKSLLDEISETLEKKQSECKKLASEKEVSNATITNSNTSTNNNTNSGVSTAAATNTSSKIKFEISSLSDAVENKPFPELKKPIARNPPITKDHAKPKINVFHKYSDSDSNCSDNENGISAYYDVVETQISYENLPDGKCDAKDKPAADIVGSTVPTATVEKKCNKNASNTNDTSIFSSSQYITDMLLSSKTRAASYNLHEGNFMTSKITSDGLIVTKCSSDDALDSTGSSFDGSSDEETSYNMIRSESDSGIGISIGNEYKNCGAEKERIHVEKKLSVSTNNSDYEDIQVANQTSTANKTLAGTNAKTKTTAAAKAAFILEKSRELHGEPDGSADPDGSLEKKEANTAPQQSQLPALPKSPPPTKLIDARPSFLHGLQKQHPPILLKKPDLPAKPVVSPTCTPLKTFVSKRTPTNAEQQVINQLHLVISKSNENLNLSVTLDAMKDDAKLKKGRAPNPPPEQKTSAPPTPERDYNAALEFDHTSASSNDVAVEGTISQKVASAEQQSAPTIAQAQAESKFINDHNVDVKKSNDREEADKLNIATCQSTSELTTTAIAAKTTATPATNAGVTNTSSIYNRKAIPTATNNTNSNNTKNAKNASSPVIREKDKRERATVNPKFRSLNTFATQRSNALKNMQLQSATSSLSLKQTLTPEPLPKNHKSLSLSEECLADVTQTNTTVNLPTLPATSDKKLTAQQQQQPQQQHQTPPQKTKTKFSIKKFLRMGASKTTDNLHKKDSIYSEICTGEEAGVVGKPRLVIIHPIDINPTAVEVVKDITKTSDAVAAQTVAVVTAKPPAPPLRNIDTQRSHELNKPARPPPPKSAELRRKQAIIGLNAVPMTVTDAPIGRKASGITASEAGGSMKCKSDNVYANLGEIRSSIAPRKPERTASMREREAQLELARKRHAGARNENADTISICSSNGDNVSFEHNSTNNNHLHTSINPNGAIAAKRNTNGNSSTTLSPQLSPADRAVTPTTPLGDGKPPTGSRTSTFERRKSDPKIAIANKLEIFENRTTSNNNSGNNTPVMNGAMTSINHNEGRPTSLKDSVRKINSTIDSYLKDKRDYENMYEMVKSPSSPPLPPTRSVDLTAGQRLLPPRRNNNNNSNLYSDTMSVTSYTRSEYGPGRNFGLNNSLANIPRIISASYCGSEVGEFEIYAPYSYYGSEAGGDVATDINDSVWGIPSAIKHRTKATNRLRMRKGRSVVHKTIEDNYTAVVVANHEALAQVLDQLQQTPVIPPALRPLANAINLRFEDFTILDGAQAFVVGKKAFHAALWTTASVTLALSADCNQLSGVGGELNQLSGGVCGVLNPITEFCDLVPSYHLPLIPSTAVTLLQATISVLPRLQLDTLQSIGAILKGKSQVLDKSNFNFRGSIPNLAAAGLKDSASVNALRNVVSVQNLSTLNEESSLEKSGGVSLEAAGDSATTAGMPAFDDVMTREVAFIMLQLVNGMKNLQGKAIEEMPLSLSNVVLSKDVENKDAQARLCVLQGNNNEEDEPMGTLCKCAHIALTDLLPATKITPIVADILLQERAESLSKSKSVLEFVLWGPSDVVLSGSTKERELALQRWLDLERATVLHGLVRTRVELTVYDECHLMFLVRSTAKMMNDAAKIVCSYQQPETIQHQQQGE